MPRHILPFVFSAFAAFCCGAQTPEYKAAQYSGYINRFYTLCFDAENMLWSGGPSNGLPSGLPNGVFLHRVDANLNLKAGGGFNAEPDIEYPAEIGWDAGNRIVGCGNYQDGGFGTGFVFRFRPQTTPSQLLFLKKIEGGQVRLSGLIENTADTSLLVYGTSLEGGVQRGELFRFQRNTGALRPGFPRRYSVGQGLSFDAAILHAGRLYTAGACSLGSNSTTFGLTCLDAASGNPLWFAANPAPAGQAMHLEARDLIFTDDDGDALLIVGNGDEQHSPAQGSHIFLQKSRLDGTLQWIKKIDLPDWTDEYAEEVVAVSDGYLILGHSRNPAEQGVFLLKTDLNGKPVWAKRILRGSETWLPDWPAQAQMLVRNEAIYLTCNALVTTAPLSPPNVGLIFKLQLDGTLANCSMVQPTPAVDLPFDNLASIELGLSASASPLQANTVAASVLGSGGTFSPGTICQQTGYVCNDRPDLTARVDSAYCSAATGGLGAAIRLCNKGKTANPYWFYVSFYDSNPLTGPAKRVFTQRFFNNLEADECEVAQFALSPAFKNNTRYYTLVGADTTTQTPISLSNFPLPSGMLECDYTNNLDSFDLNLPPDCFPTDCNPDTYLRTLASAQDFQNLSALHASGDGNLYMAGHRKGRTLIAKMTPKGKFLWARSFTIAPFDRVALSEIIVDSEGMIVGCGRQGAGNTSRGIAFRYDLNADQMLWIQLFDSSRPEEGGIMEKGPGGNYLLYQSPRLPEFLVQNGEILELNRTTGQIVPSFAQRYQHGYSEGFASMVLHDGALYATGFVDSVVNNELARRMLLTKINPNTGEVQWSRMGHIEWEKPAYFRGYDLLVDDGHLLTMYYGSEETYRIHLGDGIPTYTFLQKSTLDGEVLWVKRYKLASPRNIMALPDGYILTSGTGGQIFLKIDKEGNPLNTRRLSKLTGSNNSNAQQQKSIERIGTHLFMAGYETTNGGIYQQTVLLKTDLNLNLEYDCNGYIPTTVQDSVTAFPPTNFPAPQTQRPSPAVQQTPVPAFALDTVVVQKTECPICPDSLCVDLTARVDSITCSFPEGAIAHLSICNLGSATPDTGFHLTFYDKNPLVGGAVALQSVFLEEKPAPGACVQAVVQLDAALLQQAQIFTLVGADGNVPTPVSLSDFPLPGGFAECDYANNLDSFSVKKPDCAPDSCHPSTFWKIFGRQGNWINISALRAAPDGNLYMAGRQDDHLTIGKMAPDGQFLWTRSLTLTPLQRPLIAEIIVDSEGMVVGSGNLTAPNTGENKGVFAFRYNPTTHQVLWTRNFNANRSMEGGILEKTPGGNFLMHYNITTLPGQIGAEILELERTTGQIVPAFAKRYEYQHSQAFSNVVAHDGAIYATGYTIRKVGNSGFRRMVLLKMNESTGDVIWSRTGLTDWPQASDFAGGDLIVDDNCLLALYYGSETTNNAVGNAIKLYLQKTTLDGEVLWVKKYDLAAFPKELVATPDGYIIFGSTPFRTFLKTDKEGNLLVSKRLETPSYFVGPAGIGEQNQAERIGQHLYFAHETARSNQIYGYTTLLKTDLNLEMDFDCGLSPFPITHSSVTVQPNIAAPQTVTASPVTQGAVATAIGPDSVILHKSCPTCTILDCSDRPDLTARVDSITCSFTGGAIAHLSVCNLGTVAPDTGFHLTFYDKNPLVGGAAALQSVFWEGKPAPGACVQAVVQLDAALLQQPLAFTLLGADGNVPPPVSLSDFPLPGGFAECDYANNLDSFSVKKPDCGGGGDCADSKTFLKKLGSRLDSDLAYSMCKTADGNLYLAGRKNPVDLFITKMTPGGEVLWTRKIPVGTQANNTRFAEIIEDSDGKVVFSATQGTTPNTRTTIAMRYDPAGDSLIWFKFYGSTRPATAGIVEKTPGGDFLLVTYSQVMSTGRIYAQMWEVGRNTGELIPGSITSRYEGSSLVRFERMVARQNGLYATGARQQDTGEPTRSILTKLSASTGGVEWTQATTPDSTSSSQPDVLHTDLEFDGDFALMAGSGLQNAADPAQGIFAYLEKHAPDGSLLWLKRYEVSMYPEDVLALPDAYVIFGKMADNRWGLLKTDKEGNPLIFKTLNTSAASLGNTLLANRQGLMLGMGDHLFMADDGPMTDDPSAVWLLKTDHDFGLDAACDLLQPASVQATTMPAKSALVPLTRTPFTSGIADAGVIYQKDSLQICGICPACPCCAPDLTARVDSIGCSFFDGIVAHVSVCNLGEMTPDTGFHLTFYDKNPLVGGATALHSVFVEEKPAPGACVQTVVPLNAALFQHPKIYTLVGADGNVPTPVLLSGFPFSNGYAECSYANNLDSFATVLLAPQKLDLGPDRNICQGQAITLDAGSGYVSYNWLNGTTTQTLSVSTTGTYIAEVIDACDRYLRDTVQITVSPYPKRTVNIVLLPGDSVTILGKTYFGTTTLTDTIPSPTGICDSLVTYNIRLDSLHCKKAKSFLRVYEASTGRVLLVTSDSSVYLAGEGTNGTLLSKLDANGNLLWTRQIFDTAQATVSIYALIEDSEGLLVGCGNRLTNGAPADRTFAFRYDPVANTVVWFKEITPSEVGRATSILEKEAGGDYLFCQFHFVYGIETVSTSEIWRLDRATGTLVGGKVWRYDSKVSILAAKMHQGALYATGSVEDASSPNGRYGVMRIDPNTGAIVWAQKTIGSNVGDRGRDLLVDTEGNIVTLTGGVGSFWLQKTSPNGNLLWWRKYEIVSPLDGPYVSIAIKLLKDGSYVVNSVANNLASGGAFRTLAFLKIDQNGTVLWGKRVPEAVGAFGMGPQSLAVQGNDTYFTWLGTTSASSMISGTLFGKFDGNGNIGEGCTVEDLTATFVTENATQVAVSLDVTNPVRTLKSPIISPPVSVKLLPHTRCSKCISPCEPVAVTRTITFYPGDTIVIGGTAYTQPDTVVQNFTTSAGCDSVVTNILQLVITAVKIDCPTDLTVTLPPNEATTAVDYASPTATTDCPDPTITLRLLQGLPVGGSFPQGKTLVCYEAANQCGIRDTCCFTVTAEIPEQPCDVKTPPGCVRYELLSIQLDALGQRRYRVRLTNNCPSPLRFAYLQLPNGVLATKPAHNATYNAPSGSAYAVRNPNASPFYSVRYEAVVENLNNGESDVFEYTLPQQSKPEYIHVAARLADGSYSQAHLNTFFCPEVVENLEWRTEGPPRSSWPSPFSMLHAPLSVWPNPTDGTLFVDLNGWRGQTIRLQVLNAQGQTVLSQQVWAENGRLELALPTNVVNGLYYLTVQPEGGERRAVRFVVER